MYSILRNEKRKKALLVGDSYFVGNAFADFFQKNGYQIASVGSEADEISAGVRFQPDIVIIDYEMQHNDPYLVVAFLHESLPESCIALLNGHNRKCNEVEAKSVGAKKILSRSCDASAFDDIVHQAEEEVYL